MDNFDSSELFKKFDMMFDIDDSGDKHEPSNVSLTLGVVVDTDDPLEEGRLRIFCPSLNDNPKKLQHLPWAVYASPFGGSVNNSCFTRGTGDTEATSKGSVHYGFWAVPEQGAHVIVGCVDGDPRRRFWLGCLPSHQETHTLFNGRYKWSGGNGTPDGPLTSSGDKLQPLYDNLTEAFVDRTSAEWKTRGAEYQAAAITDEVPNKNKQSYLDDTAEQIQNAEEDSWVKDILGAHGYDWTAFKNLGAFKSSKVFGFTTPGGHTFMMDDRPFNSRVKFRTVAGHQILLDDTNERIYVSTNKGNCYIEMDSSGNMDVYTKRRLSVHSEKDINFSTDETFRVKAKKGIFMYAGDTTGQSPLPEVPADGQIRFHSTDDMHVYSEKNIRIKSDDNLFVEIANNIDILAGADIDMKATNLNVKMSNIKQECSALFSVRATDVGIKGSNSVIIIGSSSQAEIGSEIVLNSTSEIKLANSSVKTSLTGINTKFTQKADNSGSPLSVESVTPPSDISTPATDASASETKISVWTNRVPEHEPWPRVMKQDSDDTVNSENSGYKNNVDWIDQYDNSTSPAGRQPIGKTEGDETINRGTFWRR